MPLQERISTLGSSFRGLSFLRENACLNNFIQTRTATKRASGSKTNKNDSAGRRLGPKVFEGNYVKPGQIIMRQRGTKVHPGENVEIGKDHTVYAMEPGYVRFYYDPFHPLRKYVGVALKSSLALPTPHFSPRVRRFGYEVITDPLEAEKEESHMSRKEYLQMPELKKRKEELESLRQETVSRFKDELQANFKFTSEKPDLNTVSYRLLKIYELLKVGLTLEEAASQTTYSYTFDLKLASKRGEISAQELQTKSSSYISLAKDLDETVSVDEQGKLYAYLTPESRKAKRDEILTKLKSKLSDKLLSKEEQKTIKELITTPGLFSNAEQSQLKDEYLPAVLPLSVKESVVEDFDTIKKSKDVTTARIFNEESRKVEIIGRKKEAFLSQA